MAVDTPSRDTTAIRACIFDLDGVVVDTAKYHFLAWRRLADSLGIPFSEQDNERLKGVSRIESLKLILALGNQTLSEAEFEQALVQKNAWYLEYIEQLDASEILPGADTLLAALKRDGVPVALGSASKNAVLILERLNLTDAFDAIVDGTRVSEAKPDPEVFLTAARELNTAPQHCLVFEDAAAGVQAARNAGMHVVGIGEEAALPDADFVLPGLAQITLDQIQERIAQGQGAVLQKEA
ncbi:beta-phosphoglucomutase [Ferrimonas gelatinilytica]|uniref:Beta-phosphoglucomutase n=1 Tax=Ferrimonas gelatinilytica TaxID=1255257 RepID=A0ABP9RT62_9GAMM